MKKFLWMICYNIICIQLTGCAGWAVRTSTSTKPRLDQEISGNRGYILGQPANAPKEPVFTERKLYRMEVELPDWPRSKVQPSEDKTIWGNRGYLAGGPESQAVPITPKTYPAIKGEDVTETTPAASLQPAELSIYEVRKGDTLQKISLQFYGTTKKWLKLYEANKDKLKSADAIFPGQVLVIPEAK